MDISLSRKGDYAVRAAISLARHSGDGYRKIREVAEEMALPERYTPQILGLLARAGLAEAKAGRDGGYRLTRHPEEVSLLEVVEAAEGPLTSTRCTLRGGPCQWDNTCPVHHVWTGAREALRHSLANVSLASVAEEDRAIRTRSEKGA
jgi:Rrf2 family protein